MLHHIVLMKFKPGTSDEDVERLENLLDALPEKIIEIQTYEFGRDVVHSERSYDFALVSGFSNMEALGRYQVHSEHQKVVAHIRKISEDIRAVDFSSKYTPPEKFMDPDPLDGFKMP